MSGHSTPSGNGHAWKFFRAGGLDQALLQSGADLLALDQLDQKLWVALSCPTRGLEFDSKTLDLIDTDKDGRIRVPDLLAAVKWACEHVKNPGDLLKGGGALPLGAINDTHDSGKQLMASAKEILKNLGKPDASAITVEDTTDTAKIFAQTRFNGDGVIPPASAADDETKLIIGEIIGTVGAEADRSGAPGVNQAKVDAFFGELQSYHSWWHKAKAEGASILPMGDATPSAYDAFKAVRAKVDDYFARCRIAAFDSRAAGPLNRSEAEFVALAAKELTNGSAELAALPLARVEAGRALPLKEGVNPAWAAAIDRLQREVITPLCGADKTSLTAGDWETIGAKLAGYEAWLGGKAGSVVEKLGIQRIEQILAGKTRDELNRLIASDKALEPEFAAIAAVDKLARLYRDLATLLNNFVSFPDFYSRQKKAIFQCGTLFLDGRSCDLCIKVDDVGKHAALAPLSKMYLAYCDCVRKVSNEKMTIAAVFSAGDSDNLMVGRNGIFYDRAGRDWDATITKIVENPISIGQAFWSPYKKVVRFIEEQVTKRAAAADAAASGKLTSAVTDVGKAAETGKSLEQKPKLDTGLIAALGVAAAGLGGMIGGITSAFLGLGPLMPLGILGLILLISGPSMVLAWLKLRKRNLGPLLDANGWAINGYVKVNFLLGRMLTKTAQLPPGAIHSLEDPFEDKDARQRRRVWVLIALLAAIVIILNQKGVPEFLGERFAK
ncbi:MAG: hypothetical protein AB1705_16660 [Verrucomicrobiota bacterium]